MTQIKLQPSTTNPAIRSRSSRQFVVRFIVSSVSCVAGMVSFVMAGPVMCRVAAIDPALEVFYLALVAGWSWSLGRMWSLTIQARNRK